MIIPLRLAPIRLFDAITASLLPHILGEEVENRQVGDQKIISYIFHASYPTSMNIGSNLGYFISGQGKAFTSEIN